MKKLFSVFAVSMLSVLIWGCSSSSTSSNKGNNKNDDSKTEKVAKNKASKKKAAKSSISSKPSSSEQPSESSSSLESSSQESAQTSSSESAASSSSSQAAVQPITDADQALQIAQAAFEYAQGKTTDTTTSMDPSSGPNSDGSFTLKLYGGAKGLDVYTVKPLSNDQVSVNVKFGSVQGGAFTDGGTKVITRP